MDAIRSVLAGMPLTQHPKLPLLRAASPRTRSVVPASESDAFLNLENEVNTRLNRYKALQGTDDTVEFLRITMQYLPTNGCITLMQDILALNDTELKQLRDHFVDAILKPFKATGGTTVPVTPSPCEGFAQSVALQMIAIEPSTRNKQAELKRECLRRDGHRCLITGFFDHISVDKRYVITDHHRDRGLHTQCSHILPYALAKFDAESALETENKSIIWEALFRYFPDLEGKISPMTINNHENLLTLADFLHGNFGAFEVALNPTEQPNKYEVKWLKALQCFYTLPETVTIRSSDPSVPLPDPVLLRTHYSIAKILQEYPARWFIRLDDHNISTSANGGLGNGSQWPPDQEAVGLGKKLSEAPRLELYPNV